MWGRINAQMLGAKPKQLPEQITIPRPGTATPSVAPRREPKRVHTSRELAAFFSRTG